jgi:hypothetical protein
MLKRNQKFIKFLTIILASIIIFTGVRYGVSKILETKPTKPVVISQVKSSVFEKSVLHKEVITSKFETIHKIQVIQTTVTQQITINQGRKSGLFKNDKLIKYVAIGRYILDLDKIKDENIVIDNDNRTITVFTTRPSVEIELLEDKTEFQDEKGKLSFWDIKLTPEESEKCRYEVKMQMKESLENEKHQEIVSVKAKESLQELLLKTTGYKYTIIINIVD